MKKIIVLPAFLFLIVNFIQAQKISLEELRKFNKMDMATFQTKIKETHKYSYYDKTESADFLLNEYESSDYVRQIGKFDYLNDKDLDYVEYKTKDRNEFQEIKMHLIKLKYKVTEKGKIPGGFGETFTDYKLRNFLVRLVIPKDINNENEPCTVIVY